MTIRESVRNWIVNLLDLNEITDVALRNRLEKLAELREYYDGIHKRQLRVKGGKFDDNLSINLCGLIVDKSVSALVGDPADGQGLSWTFPSETTRKDASGKEIPVKPKQIEWLDAQWESNKQPIFLHKNALTGAESGFPCIKLVPDGQGNVKLVNLNPLLLTVETEVQDAETVIEYRIRYIVIENNKQVQYLEETKPNNPERTSWTVETKKKVGGKWQLDGAPVLWEYDFPPILEWQNLPCTDSPYGRSDIEGIIGVQDRYNFLVSNISKIVRLYAHPQRYGRDISAQMENGELKMGPDDMPLFNSGSVPGEIVQLAPVGELSGAMLFLQSLRESAFVLSREVDTLSLKDKVGAITNFALRVLYRDFLDKLGTKRMLYGAAYIELNRRMLILGGFEGETCTIQWPDPLPVNQVEETAALQTDMNLKLVSIQTAQEMRGYDHEKETERMAGEAQAGTNAGALLLNNFFKTGGQQPQVKPNQGE